MEKIEIGNTKVGLGEKTFIIAEAGINHDGDFIQAKKLVKEAAKAGSDSVKFQIFRAEEFCNENLEYFDLYKSLEFDKDEWIELANYAKKTGIMFTASVFGEESTDILNDIGVSVYKIASGDLTNSPLLDYVSKTNLPIILSTGMANIDEIDFAIKNIYKSGNRHVGLMHCVSNYPTRYEDTNLSFIKNLKETFKIPVGFSDHTIGTLIPALAVIMGADIIEKHFTSDKSLPGPDHKLSLDTAEFKEMVKNIRIAEASLGDGTKKLTKEEECVKESARRSLTAAVEIKEGTIITKDMIKILRPGTGIEPKFINTIIGKKAKKDIKKHQPIEWGEI